MHNNLVLARVVIEFLLWWAKIQHARRKSFFLKENWVFQNMNSSKNVNSSELSWLNLINFWPPILKLYNRTDITVKFHTSILRRPKNLKNSPNFFWTLLIFYFRTEFCTIFAWHNLWLPQMIYKLTSWQWNQNRQIKLGDF